MEFEIFSKEAIDEMEKHLQDCIIAVRALGAAQKKGDLPIAMKEAGEFFQSSQALGKVIGKAMRTESKYRD